MKNFIKLLSALEQMNEKTLNKVCITAICITFLGAIAPTINAIAHLLGK